MASSEARKVLPLTFDRGSIVNEQYEIIDCVALGTRSTIYSCRNLEIFGLLFAMKVLHPELASDPVAVARFRNEVLAYYDVNHENVVRAYEFIMQDDVVAFTMEYVSGGTLADLLDDSINLNISTILRLLCEVGRGLQAIHDAGIIHRDLKPESILLTASGEVKIADLGIARTDKFQNLTAHGGVVGSVDYLSPEYLEHGKLDKRSDIYAFGMLAYTLLRGGTPFTARSFIDSVTKRLRSEITPPSQFRKDCPSALEETILKAMHNDPEQRFQTVHEMTKKLEEVRATCTQTLTLPKSLAFSPDPDSAETVKLRQTEVPIGSSDIGLRVKVHKLILRTLSRIRTFKVSGSTAKVITHYRQGSYQSYPDLVRDLGDALLEDLKRIAQQFKQLTTRSISELSGYWRTMDAFHKRGAAVMCGAFALWCIVLLPIFTSHSVQEEKPLSTPPQPEVPTVQSIAHQDSAQLRHTLRELGTRISQDDIENPADDVREQFRTALTESGLRDDRKVTAALAELLLLEDPLLRVEVLRSLSSPNHLRTSLGYQIVIESLNDKEYLVRGFAAKSLGRVAHARSIQALRARQEIEQNEVVLQVIERALRRLGNIE